jgi:pimeloyl-ACP methyl ester carboxylesterase
MLPLIILHTNSYSRSQPTSFAHPIMAAKILTTSWLLFHTISASPVDVSDHANGYCKELDIPVTVTAPSAIYDVPRIDSNFEATAWAVNASGRTSTSAAVIETTTTSGTYNIHGRLCVPKSSNKSDILQIATHGVGFDSRYWDAKYQPEKHSYVAAALKAGYSIFTYDRLGTGRSDHPDAYKVVQPPIQLEILRQLTLIARNGTLYHLAGVADAQFSGLAQPRKFVHIGHSFGSALTSALIVNYGDLSDGAVLTGFIQNPYLGSNGITMWSFDNAATSSPPFDRPSGYVVSTKKGVHNVFLGGNPKTAYTPELLNYADSIKQPAPIAELVSFLAPLGNNTQSFKAPLQYVLAEFDLGICAGDCKGLTNMTALMETYSHATTIKVDIQPNTGHGFPLHNNATAGFQLTFDFLAANGL